MEYVGFLYCESQLCFWVHILGLGTRALRVSYTASSGDLGLPTARLVPTLPYEAFVPKVSQHSGGK